MPQLQNMLPIVNPNERLERKETIKQNNANAETERTMCHQMRSLNEPPAALTSPHLHILRVVEYHALNTSTNVLHLHILLAASSSAIFLLKDLDIVRRLVHVQLQLGIGPKAPHGPIEQVNGLGQGRELELFDGFLSTQGVRN